MHTIFRWGDRIVNKYDLSDPGTRKFVAELRAEHLTEKCSDIYYREWFKVEPLSDADVEKALQ